FLGFALLSSFFVTVDPHRVIVVLGLNVGEIVIDGEIVSLEELRIVGDIGNHEKIMVCIVIVEQKFMFEIVVVEVVAIIGIDLV
nr:hypothetical protein [Tanacetum cinerariifolium]GEZ80170.1 hypothetical protein [Tanacetum cinerariifolium]